MAVFVLRGVNDRSFRDVYAVVNGSLMTVSKAVVTLWGCTVGKHTLEAMIQHIDCQSVLQLRWDGKGQAGCFKPLDQLCQDVLIK